MTWIPPTVLGKFKFIAPFNPLSPVYVLSSLGAFPSPRMKRDGSETKDYSALVDRHDLLSATKVHASVASLSLEISTAQVLFYPWGPFPVSFLPIYVLCIQPDHSLSKWASLEGFLMRIGKKYPFLSLSVLLSKIRG